MIPAVFLGVLVSTASSAHDAFPIDATPPQAPVAAEAPDATSLFEQGRFTANTLASIEFGDEGDAQYLGHFGGGWFVLDGLSLNAEVLAGVADPTGEEEALVIGLDAVLRWHLLRGADDDDEEKSAEERRASASDAAAEWSLFLDIGGGIQQASDEFPPGSHFNFRSRLGFGGTIEVAEDVSLIGGASFVHISNSNIGDENPGMSGTLVYVGVLFHF